jgi:ubiquinone/menaquinone biosynthesis C-methylase UbiE
MERAHEKVVEAQFGPRAKAYVESAVHAQGEDLEALDRLLAALKPERALDLGTGGGHVSYLMARYVGRVVAADLSRDMLAAVAATARDRGLGNIETVETPAERLPFDSESFDFLACRYSTHHWRDLDAGLGEAHRVLRRGAPAAFIDVYSTGVPLLDTHLQAVELLRDTSHVRDYSAAEWFAALARAGFVVKTSRTWRVRMEFAVWTARMRTPEANVRAIRALQAVASSETRAHFAIEDDGSFMLDMLMMESVAD